MTRYIAIKAAGLLLATAWAATAHADLPFLKETAKGAELPRAYGIGIDVFRMKQDLEVTDLTLGLPGLAVADPSVIDVENEIDYVDIKFDAWLFPFMNVFVVYGTLDGETSVDLSSIDVPQLPVPLGSVDIDYDGTVYGAGFTGVYGRDNWFFSTTVTYTDTDLDGDFSSNVKTLTVQPKIGWQLSKGQIWAGATYLDADEEHSGTIDLGIPTLPPTTFDVELSSNDNWNLSAGGRIQINEHLDASLELGFSNRTHALANATWRF